MSQKTLMTLEEWARRQETRGLCRLCMKRVGKNGIFCSEHESSDIAQRVLAKRESKQHLKEKSK